jgi:beta-lactam-binding protein with PASTA domain
LLKRSGFSADVQLEETSQYPPGVVTGQQPAAGRRAKRGATVLLLVSERLSEEEEDEGDSRGRGRGRGQDKDRGGGGDEGDTTTVPDVLGMTRGDAEDTIRDADLVPEVIYRRESDRRRARANRGRVWKQSPASGGRVERGSPVYIWVNP